MMDENFGNHVIVSRMKIEGNLSLEIDRPVEATYEIGWKPANSLTEVYGNWFSTSLETGSYTGIAFSKLSSPSFCIRLPINICIECLIWKIKNNL